MTSVVIADDHPIVNEGLSAVLRQAGILVSAAVGDGRALIDAVKEFDPDLAIIDVWMPVLDGIATLTELRKGGADLPVLLLTAGVDDAHLAALIEAGADGIIFKQSAGAHLVEAVETILRGEPYFEPPALERARAWADRSSGKLALSELSEREQAIALAASDGTKNREIAEQFGVSEGAIKVSLHRIYDKLGVTNRTELALLVKQARIPTGKTAS
ncbi:response regulator [Novosphingobium sp.]|uniref:response regulator transcription factor n=1 Tax=Novosphingobium sp. TaxID=1874826 RepID=UPI0035B3AF29